MQHAEEFFMVEGDDSFVPVSCALNVLNDDEHIEIKHSRRDFVSNLHNDTIYPYDTIWNQHGNAPRDEVPHPIDLTGLQYKLEGIEQLLHTIITQADNLKLNLQQVKAAIVSHVPPVTTNTTRDTVKQKTRAARRKKNSNNNKRSHSR
jgi:hypothetical protein